MKRINIFSLLFLVIISLMLFVSCSENENKITLIGVEDENIVEVGTIINFDYQLEDSIKDQKVIVYSSNKQVVKTNDKELYAVGTGKCEIKVSLESNKNIYKAFNITVKEAKEIYDKKPTSITIIGKEEKVEKNSSIIVNVNTTGSYPNREVVWESSNEEIVVVKDGKITGLKEGKAVITVTSKLDSEVTDSFEIEVVKVNTQKTTILSFEILLKGMVAIFVAIAVIFISIVTLNKVTNKK